VARAVVCSCVAAIVVFAIVQDRLTVAGVGQYVSDYREAAAGRRAAVTIDEVMRPAVTHAVEQGALWGGAVLAVGLSTILGSTLAARRRTGRG
jgi:hypothetical protein